MKQTKSLSQSGSFINWLMGNNQSVPVAGEWATICYYSDRSVCKVLSVSEDGKRVEIQHYNTTGAGENLQMGHQSWEHHPSDNFTTLVYRNGAWRSVSKSIVFIDSWYKEFEQSGKNFSDVANDLNMDLWDSETGQLKLIAGVTRIKTEYAKKSIIFGACDYHYDWSF
jgi:hypothetical protein